MTSRTAHSEDANTTLDVIDVTHQELESGGEVVEATVRVPEDLLYFSGHFPEDPVLPGVVQINGAALPLVERSWPDLGRLLGVKRLKFIKIIRPGDTLRVRLERRAAPGQVALTIFGDGDGPSTSGVLAFAVETSP